MPKSAKRPAKSKPVPRTVPAKQYNTVRSAAVATLNFLCEMERQTAIRLPYPGYPEMLERLAKAVGAKK